MMNFGLPFLLIKSIDNKVQSWAEFHNFLKRLPLIRDHLHFILLLVFTKPSNEFVLFLLLLLLFLLLKNEMKSNSERWWDLILAMVVEFFKDEFYLTRGLLYLLFISFHSSITPWPPIHLALLIVMSLSPLPRPVLTSNPFTSNERLHINELDTEKLMLPQLDINEVSSEFKNRTKIGRWWRNFLSTPNLHYVLFTHVQLFSCCCWVSLMTHYVK